MGLTDRRRAIVLFGDSLTQRSFDPAGGWGAALAHAYGRRCDVYNRGYGGYNTRWCRSQLPHLFPVDNSERPLLVTVMLGTNDAAIPDVAPEAYVSLEEYRDNLTAIVRHVQRSAKHVLVVTPPCMDEVQRLRFQVDTYGEKAIGVLDRSNANTAKYAAVAKEVAEARGVSCVDLFAITAAAGGGAHVGDGLFTDGIHFSARGQELVFAAITACLRAMPGASTLDPENMDPDWPFGPELRVNPEAWKDVMAAHEGRMVVTPTLRGNSTGAASLGLAEVLVALGAAVAGALLVRATERR